MERKYKEVFDFNDRTITVIHHTGYWNMFLSSTIKPLLKPGVEIFYKFEFKTILGFVYGIFAYMQDLFHEETVLDLFTTPMGLVEGLCILVAVDFAAGTYRAWTDPQIRFHPKKWGKTFNKIVFYSFGIVGITIGANMFPSALGWLQYAAFLVVTGNEIYSIAKHAKMTAFLAVAWELYKNKEDLTNIDFDKIKARVDERSIIEFAESQAYYFGNEEVKVDFKTTKAEDS